MNERELVNGLQPPTLLLKMLREGLWVYPGDERLFQVIPFFEERDSLIFLANLDEMRNATDPFIADDKESSEIFREARGSIDRRASNLPWLDYEKSFFIGINGIPGPDVGIALDYRINSFQPRVVASNWHTEEPGCVWQVVANTFAEFVIKLGAIEHEYS